MSDLEAILSHFAAIVNIPHCSQEARELKEYLSGFASRAGYDVLEDDAGNLLVRCDGARLCLQAHYDMVCVGKAPQIELVNRNGWIEAKDSSLGADNGIALAMMMKLIEEGARLEFLFTVDEEIGLIGAKALKFDLSSSYLLNLDTEEAAEVYIGCAGGVDLLADRSCEVYPDKRRAWRISLSGLPGGHSGVDIDKAIPNAIKELANALTSLEDIGLVSFIGGERRNSIPTHAEAIIRSNYPLVLNSKYDFCIESIKSDKGSFADTKSLLELLAEVPSGVISFNDELKIPNQSLNLAIVEIADGKCSIEYSLRAMSGDSLQTLASQTKELLESQGFLTSLEDAYPAWKPQINSFTRRVAKAMREEFGRSELKAIHAGLECGVLSQKYPNLHIASIGPTIQNPHSIRERVNIESIEKTFKVLRKIVNELAI